VKRVKEAVAEIKKVARKDKVLAAEGSVLFLVKVSPTMGRRYAAKPTSDTSTTEAALYVMDAALDDNIWMTPAPGQAADNVSENIASQGHKAIMPGNLMHNPIQLPYLLRAGSSSPEKHKPH